MSRYCNCFGLFGNSDAREETYPLIPPVAESRRFVYGSATADVDEFAPNYYSAPNANFYSFMHKRCKSVEFGWKLHLSLDTSVLELRQVCDAIFTICDRYDLGEFKVEKPQHLASLTGKTITIYLAYNPELKAEHGEISEVFQAFLHEIDAALVELGSRPGPAPQSNRKVVGSQYIYFRDERGEVVDEGDGLYRYISDEDAAVVAAATGSESYNPYGHEDEFALLTAVVNVHRHQPTI